MSLYNEICTERDDRGHSRRERALGEFKSFLGFLRESDHPESADLRIKNDIKSRVRRGQRVGMAQHVWRLRFSDALTDEDRREIHAELDRILQGFGRDVARMVGIEEERLYVCRDFERGCMQYRIAVHFNPPL